MKFAVLNIAIMAMILASYVTAGAKNNYRATYSFQYTKDSINSLKGNDILYLEISENKSFCFSYYTYQSDSLRRDPNGRKIWRQLFSAAIAKMERMQLHSLINEAHLKFQNTTTLIQLVLRM